MTTNDNGGDGLKVVPMSAKPDEVKAAGDYFKRHLETMIENQKVIAKLRRAAFLAYVDAGFTDAQALELCCK